MLNAQVEFADNKLSTVYGSLSTVYGSLSTVYGSLSTVYGSHQALKCLQTCIKCAGSGPEVIKLFSCSTQLSMKFSLLINMKMPKIVGIFIFISREIFVLSYVKQKRMYNRWLFEIF